MALPWWPSRLVSRIWDLGWVALQTWGWDRAEAVRMVFVHTVAGHTEVVGHIAVGRIGAGYIVAVRNVVDHIGVGHIEVDRIVIVRNEVVLLGEVHTEAVRTGLARIEEAGG